jgi:threonine dehydrogenase-like Zn-dependent dehydrogenase
VIIDVTSTAICGSDLHLYEVLVPFLEQGDVLGHEPMGVVVEAGPDAGDLKVGDRVHLAAWLRADARRSCPARAAARRRHRRRPQRPLDGGSRP